MTRNGQISAQEDNNQEERDVRENKRGFRHGEQHHRKSLTKSCARA
ncbi:hypothetical protein SNOG_05732 [Parastagonospora nodorum SN15]|uniref:Uncharacterized protein n=1 Tax=Phaeosphaeria nodorum (strain SN15 / ATCC MYA-4574 / FGSC 10173) TaxID=321614 RepID=Q0UR82_PHANO|nr:hypothetical protein SNOG_05732 [Parastagonospora nodorum SN15]EAT86796.1 hypothetical protein SNOG_05732 [Parastagonospora nodorum SN15]